MSKKRWSKELHQRLIAEENDTGKMLVFHLRPCYHPMEYADKVVDNRCAYYLVALVDTELLDDAFLWTNHNANPWYDNPGVQSVVTNARSTSIGDVVIDPAGTAFLCRNSGWSIVEPPE